jgi:hypothetical protein
MPFDSTDTAASRLPLQFVNIEITPLVGGQFAVAMQATLLDEKVFEFVGQELANERADTIEHMLAIIRANVGSLAMHSTVASP